VIELNRGCSRHRPVLIDFVDRGDVRADTAAALAHLDDCAACTEVVEATMLTITALRRMGDEAAAAEPRSDAWPRLRIRLEGWHRRPVVMSPLAGIAMSFAIVAVLVLPVRIGGTLVGGTLIGPISSPLGQVSRAERIGAGDAESAYIASVRQATLPVADSRAEAVRETVSYLRIYPDNYHPTRKEVGPTEPNGRPPEAI
jgi:hypothetical protein